MDLFLLRRVAKLLCRYVGKGCASFTRYCFFSRTSPVSLEKTSLSIYMPPDFLGPTIPSSNARFCLESLSAYLGYTSRPQSHPSHEIKVVGRNNHMSVNTRTTARTSGIARFKVYGFTNCRGKAGKNRRRDGGSQDDRPYCTMARTVMASAGLSSCMACKHDPPAQPIEDWHRRCGGTTYIIKIVIRGIQQAWTVVRYRKRDSTKIAMSSHVNSSRVWAGLRVWGLGIWGLGCRIKG